MVGRQLDSEIVERAALMEELSAIEAMLPVAQHGAQLRACGFRLVASDDLAIAALAALAEKGVSHAELILQNSYRLSGELVVAALN